jgi:hypothetical protein
VNRPALLTAGAGLALAEGLALLVVAVLEVADTTAGRVGLAVSTALFFTLLGGALLVCAYGLFHVRSWGRSPVVVVQLIVFLTAWSFWGGDTRPVAVVLAVVSLATLVCLLHPRSIEALAGE